MHCPKLICQLHKPQPILFICLDPYCSKWRKCCLSCVDDYHHSHQIVSIPKFIQQTNDCLQRYNDYPDKKQLIKLIKAEEKLTRQACEVVRSNFIELINEIQEKIQQKVSTILSVLHFPDEQTVTNHILKSLESTDLVINEYIRSVQNVKSVQLAPLKNMEKLVKFQLHQINSKIYVTCGQVFALINKVASFVNQAKLSGKIYDDDFKLSTNNKAFSIELDDSKSSISRLVSGQGYEMCVFDKPLDRINDKFFVRIGKNPNQKIWFGVCLLQEVRKKNFVGCKGLGRGTYAIDQSSAVAYSYNNPNNYATFSNHYSTNYNSQSKTAEWNFTSGDIIMVWVSYVLQEIHFNKVNQLYDSDNAQSSIFTNSCKMPIKIKQGDVYPFLGLNGIGGDEVTIVSRDESIGMLEFFGNAWLQIEAYAEVLDMSSLFD